MSGFLLYCNGGANKTMYIITSSSPVIILKRSFSHVVAVCASHKRARRLLHKFVEKELKELANLGEETSPTWIGEGNAEVPIYEGYPLPKYFITYTIHRV